MPARRNNQEGSLTLRKDGRWMARVSHEGRRITVYGQTKEEARLKLRSLQRKQDENLPLTTAQTKLKDYLAQWLETIRHQVRVKTVVDYEVAIRLHITPHLGHIRLGKLEMPPSGDDDDDDAAAAERGSNVINHGASRTRENRR